MDKKPRSLAGGALLALGAITLFSACVGGSLPHGDQSSLIDKTFAGKNKCNPKNADRPFILEWDATDQSSFQARASTDVIVVRYEGCDLKVLDGCVDDSVKGKFGSYKPVDWTSGQLETIDIADENELFAKLPLGAAALDGRVSQGEKFHMEYYVSGTRTATRDHVYAKDLASTPACKGATHFVYNYNLGAFALGSAKNLKGELNGSYFGFGAGGKHAESTNADKKGGDLGSCKSESAKEVDSCKVPIRLTLREIDAGESAEQVGAQAPETDKAANLAGKLQATTDREKQAQEHADTASTKMRARDGKGCVAELDQHDALDPRPGGLSTNPKAAYWSMMRGQCLMLAGQCDAGKELFRKAFEAGPGANQDASRNDVVVDATAGQNCQGGTLAPRDQFVKARMTLQEGAFTNKKDVATCWSAFETMFKLRATVKPKDDEDALLKEPLMFMITAAPSCLARAGDCDKAFNAYKQIAGEQYKDQKWSKNEAELKRNFESSNHKCRDK